MTAVFVSVVISGVAGLSMHRWGYARCSMALLLGSLCVFPRNIVSEPIMRHVGIAAATPRLTTYLLAVGLLAICIIFRPRLSGALLTWAGFIVFLAVGATMIWSGGPAQESGLIQLLLAPFAWAIGVNLAQDFSNAKCRFLIRAIALIVFLQLGICSLQLLDLQIFAMEATQEAILGSRANGTLGHPNDLGKVLFLLLLILLPCRQRGLSRVDANLWRVSIGCIFVVLAMTGGRAVSAASLCVLILWIVLSPGETHKKGRKVVAVGAALSVTVFLAGALLARFDEDPQGGARSTLADVAWAQILSDPWRGVGPNSYVNAVGSYDALTASGVPVHNAFLLALAELGAVGTILFIFPFLVGATTALRKFKRADQGGEASRVYLSALPGLYLITTTGWGLLGGYVLPLLALTFGLLNGFSATRSATDKTSFMSGVRASTESGGKPLA